MATQSSAMQQMQQMMMMQRMMVMRQAQIRANQQAKAALRAKRAEATKLSVQRMRESKLAREQLALNRQNNKKPDDPNANIKPKFASL